MKALSKFLKISIYIAISFSLAYLIDLYIVMTPYNQQIMSMYPLQVQLLIVCRMYTPFIAVLIILLIERRGILSRLKSYGLKLGRLRYIPIALSIPYIMYGIGILYSLLIGLPIQNPILYILSKFNIPKLLDLNTMLVLILAFSAIAGLSINAIAAIGEEIGWRGFLLDELYSSLGPVLTSTIIGIIWALWHVPLIIFLGYNYPHHRDLIGLAMYVSLCIPWSYILIMLRLWSSSILPPSITHGTINALGSLMLFTIGIEDEILTMPVGLLALASTLTIIIAMNIAKLVSQQITKYREVHEVVTSG